MAMKVHAEVGKIPGGKYPIFAVRGGVLRHIDPPGNVDGVIKRHP
jgi:hypothetical protein